MDEKFKVNKQIWRCARVVQTDADFDVTALHQCLASKFRGKAFRNEDVIIAMNAWRNEGKRYTEAISSAEKRMGYSQLDTWFVDSIVDFADTIVRTEDTLSVDATGCIFDPEEAEEVSLALEMYLTDCKRVGIAFAKSVCAEAWKSSSLDQMPGDLTQPFREVINYTLNEFFSRDTVNLRNPENVKVLKHLNSAISKCVEEFVLEYCTLVEE